MGQRKVLFALLIFGILIIGVILSPLILIAYYLLLGFILIKITSVSNFDFMNARVIIAQKDIDYAKNILLKAGYINIFLHKKDIQYVEPDLEDDFVEKVKVKLESKYNFGEGINFDTVRSVIIELKNDEQSSRESRPSEI